MSPSVSVVMVTRDRPALLADALRSVAAQSLAPLEVRLADDGESSVLDSLPELGLLELTAFPVLARQAARARNAAARGARGDVLAFLDDDDRWAPDHLEGLVTAFADSDVGLAWRDVAVIRERIGADGSRVDEARRVIARDWDEQRMRTHDYLPPSAIAVRRSRFEQIGGFDPAFRYSEDWDLVLRLAAVAPVRRVPGVTVEVRMREEGQASADFGPERLACLDALSKRHGLPTLSPMTFWEVAAIVGGSSA